MKIKKKQIEKKKLNNKQTIASPVVSLTKESNRRKQNKTKNKTELRIFIFSFRFTLHPAA